LQRHFSRHCFCAVISVETTLQFLLCMVPNQKKLSNFIWIESLLIFWNFSTVSSQLNFIGMLINLNKTAVYYFFFFALTNGHYIIYFRKCLAALSTLVTTLNAKTKRKTYISTHIKIIKLFMLEIVFCHKKNKERKTLDNIKNNGTLFCFKNKYEGRYAVLLWETCFNSSFKCCAIISTQFWWLKCVKFLMFFNVLPCYMFLCKKNIRYINTRALIKKKNGLCLYFQTFVLWYYLLVWSGAVLLRTKQNYIFMEHQLVKHLGSMYLL
jgi:hypothetical protein